jgi:hypothetical protein
MNQWQQAKIMNLDGRRTIALKTTQYSSCALMCNNKQKAQIL